MMKKLFSIQSTRKRHDKGRYFLSALVLFFLFTQLGGAQLASWNPSGLSSGGPTSWAPASVSSPNITVGNLTKGSGIGGVTTGNAWGGSNWAGGANQDGTFTIKANSGYQLSLTTLRFQYRRSNTGPTAGPLQYAINGGPYTTVTTMAFSGTATGGTAHPDIDLSGVSALQNLPATSTVTIRFFPNNGASGGTWYINGTGLQVFGNVNPTPPPCTAPTGLAATGVTSTDADLSWGTVAGAPGYQYVLNTTSADPAGAGTAITGTSFSTTTLSPSTTYYLHVRTDCGSGTFSGWSTFSFTTNPAVCTVPTALTVNSFNATSANISWTGVTGIVGFEYVLDLVASDPAGAGTATTGNTFTDNTLTPSTTYYFHLRKDCGSGNFSNWINVSFTTNLPCADPTSLTVNSFNSTSTSISWDSETGITGFEYVLDMSSTDPSGAGTATSGNTFNDIALSPSTTYYFHLRKNCGSGDFSNWINVSFTTNPPCADPTSLTVNSFNATSTDISWDSETGITGFEYVLDMNSADPAGTGTATTGNTFTDNTLTPSTTYYFHLRKDCGSGDFSNWINVSFTTNPPCADPTSLTVNSFNSTSTDISWGSETGITGFEYVLDMSSTDPSGAGTATTGNSFTDNTLTPSTTYYFHLRKDCGSGDFSNWINVSFTTNPPCADPTSLTVNSFNATSTDISWDSETGITGFEYVLDMSSTDPTGAGTATTGNTFTDNALSPSTTYYFHLRKDCGSGDFSNWINVSFTTNPPCADPTSLTVNSFNATSTDISWDSETGITGFEYVLDMSSTDPVGAGTATTGNSFTDNTLIPSTTYYFHLRKDCGSGDFSEWVTVSFTTNAPCADPTSLAVNSFNATSTDISWDSETGITGFEYVLDMSSTDPISAGTATTGNSFTDNTLTPSTTYYFHLRKDCGSGDFSEWVTVSFTTNAPCVDPTGLSTSAVDHISATLVWDNVAGITGFEYVLDMSSTDPAGAGTATTATTFSDNTLAPVTTYYFHLRKNCGSGDFSDWVTLSFTTLSTPTGVNEISSENVFVVYPNPTSGVFNFTTTHTGGTLSITDLAGKILVSQQINTNTTSIDLGTFESQVYFLIYHTTEGRQVSRIVKQ